MKRIIQFGIALFLTIGSAGAHPSKTSSDLKHDDRGAANKNALVHVIVQFKHTPTDAHHKKVTDRGGVLHETLSVIKSAHYSIPASEIDDFSDDPEVTFITPDRSLAGSLDLTSQAVNATSVWDQYGVNGSGIGIAVIDSGIDPHSDLNQRDSGRSRIVYRQDLTSFGWALGAMTRRALNGTRDI